MKFGLAITLVVGLLALPSDVMAETQNPVFAARKAAENLRSATRALKDARVAKDRVRTLSRAVRAYEDGLNAMRESLRKVAIRQRSLKLEFEARSDELSRLLGVLQTIQRVSKPLLLMHPAGPLQTARSGQILSEVVPALYAKAEDLRAQLRELALLGKLQATAKEDLQAGLKGVQDARIQLTEAIGKRTHLPKRFTTNPERLKMLVKNSATLSSFANGLSDLPFDESFKSPVKFSARKGKIPLPMFGSLLRTFNEADAAGLRRPGILLSAPAVSLITAPWPATIRYIGPLLDYGNVIILEPEAGYLIVLAGLGQVYGEVGQIVDAGAPLGLLSGQDPATKDFLVEASQGKGEIQLETLYIEIRHDRKTVNPQDWFTFDNK